MTSEISGFAITGYINTTAAPSLAGSITGLLYRYEGLANWESLTEAPPMVPRGTSFHLATWWLNQSVEPISGHVELVITKPDGTKATLADILNQNNWAAPGNGWPVQFEPVILDQVGKYQAKVTLSTMGQVLDEKTYTIADLSAPVAITSISIDKSQLTTGELFTVSFTFRNNSDYDIFVRSRFALGELKDSTFTPEKVLCGWDYVFNFTYDQAYKWDWVDLGPLQHPGSNMSNIIYTTPEGEQYGMSYAYLKVPAHGVATTSREWYMSDSPEWGGMAALYVESVDMLYLIYPEQSTDQKYHIKKLDYKVSGVLPNAANILTDIVLVTDFRFWTEKPRFRASMKVINNTGVSYSKILGMLSMRTEGGWGISNWGPGERTIPPGETVWNWTYDMKAEGASQEKIDEAFAKCTGKAVAIMWFENPHSGITLTRAYFQGTVGQAEPWSPPKCPECGGDVVIEWKLAGYYYGPYYWAWLTCLSCGYKGWLGY